MPELQKRGFFNTGNIAAGNPELCGNLLLGQLLTAAQPVPQADYLLFPLVKADRHYHLELFKLQLYIYLVRNIALVGDNIYKSQRVAVLIGIYGIAYKNILRRLFLIAEEH